MSYYIDGQLDIGGRKTDALAKKYAAEHNTTYAQALTAVTKEANQSFAQKINRARANYQQQHGSEPVNGFKVFEDNAGNVMQIELDGAATGQAITRLGNIVTGLPRNDDHSINIDLALRIIRNEPEFAAIGKEASGQFLHHIAKKIVGSSKPFEGVDLVSALREAQARFPEVSAVYNGSPMSEAALRVINGPLFKTPTAQGESMGERAYERQSVRRYVNGHEYRTYEYTPSK